MTDNAKLLEAVFQKLIDANRLTLLFHSGGPWSQEKADMWAGITGNNDATSKGLCDHIRSVLHESLEAVSK